MKRSPFFAFTSIGLISLTQVALAGDVQSLLCERDRRPVDGAYEAVELVQNEDGKYDAFYEIKVGFGALKREDRVKIAQNLAPCTFASEDTVLVQCSKFKRDPGEKTNSGFTTTRVSKTGVSDRKGNTRTVYSTQIKAFSPQLRAGFEKVGFPSMERKGTLNMEFGTNPHGFMQNGCTVK